MSRYVFVLVALLSVIGGLLFDFSNQELLAKSTWGVGALLGFYFSIRWLLRSLRQKELGSDVLALISILATVLTDEWLAASIIALMLSTGQALEKWAEGQSSKHLDALLARAPQFAHLIDTTDQITDIAIQEVKAGSRILVRSGEVVPIDGLVEQESLFDQSALTGEAIPVWHEVNTKVDSGVVNVGSPVVIKTTATAAESTYANLISLVASAKAQASKGVRLANVWAARFVPVALAMALITYLISKDVNQAVAVIVAATPCPLILAVPVAIVSGISRAAQKGVIIKTGEAVERLADAEVILLDKTGTLTEGGPQITNQVFAKGVDPNQVIQLAASLEQHSSNIVARAMVAQANHLKLDLVMPTNVVEIHGHGLAGMVSGKKVTVGQPELPLPEWGQLTNSLLVEIKIDDEVQAIIGLDDPLRKESQETVSSLRTLGVNRVLLVSGDRKPTVEAIANQLGITEFFAECSPTQKLAILETELKATTGSVLVVGDGINDAPALATADVGIAMGAKGTTAASQAASVVIVEDSIRRLVDAVQVSKLAKARALQASAVGMGLALLAMLGSSLGYLDASQAALVQEFIDAAAIIWALLPSGQLTR